jgi:hypothetical protein
MDTLRKGDDDDDDDDKIDHQVRYLPCAALTSMTRWTSLGCSMASRLGGVL